MTVPVRCASAHIVDVLSAPLVKPYMCVAVRERELTAERERKRGRQKGCSLGRDEVKDSLTFWGVPVVKKVQTKTKQRN